VSRAVRIPKVGDECTGGFETIYISRHSTAQDVVAEIDY
jgi:hypothetical protein